MDMTVEVPELPELTFDEASHIYRLNGDIIPSVSELMEPLKDQCYGGISKRTLENAAIKGSAVHNSIENWIKFGIDDIPSEHRGYFNGFVEWWKQYKPRVFGSEVRIYHKLMRYGGTIDLLCEIGGLLELIDFKTTYTLLEMACGVQLEAYSQALISHGITPQRKHILHLKKDGKWSFREFPAKDPARCRVPEERTGRPLWQRRLPADGRGCCKGKLPRIRCQSGRHHHDNGRPAGHGGGVERSKTWTKRN